MFNCSLNCIGISLNGIHGFVVKKKNLMESTDGKSFCSSACVVMQFNPFFKHSVNKVGYDRIEVEVCTRTVRKIAKGVR